MSKRMAGIAVLLGLLATGASAETLERASYTDANDRVFSIGESDWELFRPKYRALEKFDLAYMTDDLRSKHTGYGLRFHSSSHVTFNLQIDLLAHSEELYGPIYDMSSGATVFSIGFSF
jgi:hypothetical protein